ncbi:MAG: hypothetical protein RLZZ520_832 [Bacteroidota bacterium]|jgi:hypothetical protein
MKIKAILFVAIQLLVFDLTAQDNRVSRDEDLQNIFKGTWDLRSPENTIDVNADFTDNVTDAPIDGGLSFLMAAGVLYGAKRIRRTKVHKSKR